jgi:hypothetical protein
MFLWEQKCRVFVCTFFVSYWETEVIVMQGVRRNQEESSNVGLSYWFHFTKTGNEALE